VKHSDIKEFNCIELDEKDIEITSNDNNIEKKRKNIRRR
jgi:hypothetical protein